MVATLGLVVATQIGIFNKCSCYTLGGKTGLTLPQIPIVKSALEHRLELQYPAITVTGVVAQLVVFPGIIVARYYAAVRVFLQRDDGKSSLQWCNNISSWTWWITQKKAFNDWTKKKCSICPADDGCELGDVATLLEGGQDKVNETKSATSHVE